MKPFARNIMFTGVLAMAVGSMAIAQTSNNWSEQWYRAKYGRPSPAEEARVKTERANIAYREEVPLQASVAAKSWFEGWYRAKYGRPSPTEEARLEAEQANTAYREETPSKGAISVNTWYEGWYRAKFGRPSPLKEIRSNEQNR